ncbi:MAG: NFACT RNA binding domain-containing protein, partial [Chitinophagales bacterium]
KLYTKARKAREHLAQMIADNRRDIEYLESVVLEIEKAENMAELEDILDELEQEGLIKHRSGKKKQREEAKGPRAFKSADNLDILVGRNNRQNDLLTLKKAGKNDLWLHVQGFAGTHVILSLPSQMESVEDIPDRSLEDAAMLAAYYSKAKEAEKVAIDYTFRYNVKKPRGARPGMVIYDNYWTINVNPSDPRLKELLQGEKN